MSDKPVTVRPGDVGAMIQSYITDYGAIRIKAEQQSDGTWIITPTFS